MIWVGGRIVLEEALTIGARDRTFEHGLGLFETLRTWNGRAALLDRHRARLTASAEALGILLPPGTLPDHEAVAALLVANHVEGDAMLRITLTGGDPSGAVLWMRTAALPPPARMPGLRVALSPRWEVARDDPTARHKMLNYWSRRSAFEGAKARGYDEVLSSCPSGRYWEGSRTNCFVIAGDGTLITPALAGPIVPGVLRGLVLELARGLPIAVREVEGLSPALLLGASELFLTNAVRGIMAVAEAGESSWTSPGPWTRRFQDLVGDRVARGGQTA